MILTILALLAAPGDHAHLHPADADLYVSVPEAQEVMAALETVGLFRLYKDPEIAALFGGAPDFLDGIPFLPTEAAEGDSLEGSLQTITAYSLSVAGLDEFEAVPDLGSGDFDKIMATLFKHEAMGVVEFESAESAQAAIAAITSWVSEDIPLTMEIDLGEARETLHEIPGGTLSVKDYVVVSGDSAHGLWVAEWGGHVAVGIGEAGAPGLLARLRGGENLAGTDHWIRGVAAMREEGGTLYMNYHHSLIGEPWYALAAQEQLDHPLTGLLLRGVELFFGGVIPLGASEEHGSCRIVDGEYVFEVMDFSQPTAESNAPLPEDFLRLVNPEAVGVWATTLDLEAVAGTGHAFIAELLGLPVEAVATELEYSVGTSLEEFLAPLKEGVAFYMLPISGATIPRFHAVVPLEDSAAYAESWTQLAEFLKAQGTEFVHVTDRPYRKTPVFSFKQVSEESPATDASGPLGGIFAMGLTNPSFTVAILPDRALFGVSSSYVKREVRRILKEEGAEAVLHPLVENGPPCPAGVNYFGHLDWPEVVGSIYDTVTAFLPLIAGGADLPFDIDALPATETITQYFSVTDIWSRAGESGTYTLKHSPIGFETGLSLAAVLVIGAWSIQTTVSPGEDPAAVSGGESDPPTPVVEEPGAVPDLAAKKETRFTLQEVKLGLVIYKSENASFPGALSDLLAPTATYPRGFLNSDTLPADGWGNELQYAAAPGGAGYRLWSAGPDGVNNGGDGDDVPSS